MASIDCRLPSLQAGENLSLSLNMQSVTTSTHKLMDVKSCDVIALAKKALLASREAASLAEESKLFDANTDEFLFPVSVTCYLPSLSAS